MSGPGAAVSIVKQFCFSIPAITERPQMKAYYGDRRSYRCCRALRRARKFSIAEAQGRLIARKNAEYSAVTSRNCEIADGHKKLNAGNRHPFRGKLGGILK